MKTKFLKKTIFYFLLLPSIIACDEFEPYEGPVPYVPGENGVFILNEGSWGANNAGVSYYNLETDSLIQDIMGGKLGDTGQDMMIYGNKLYISVNVSSVIDVVGLDSLKSIKRIPLSDGDIPRSPRYLAAWEGNVYVTTFDGHVVRIDTTQLEVNGITKVGDNPDGIAAVGGKLYVANSGGMNPFTKGTSPDSTLSVVDIAQFKQEKTIQVGMNPYIVKADKEGNLYVTYRGINNINVPSGIQKVDTKTGTVSNLPISANQKFDILDDLLYFYNGDYDDNGIFSSSGFGIYDLKKAILIFSDETTVKAPYGIGVNPQNKDIYVSDWEYPNRAKVFVFGSDGKKRTTLDVGVGANTFAFY